MSKFKAWWLRNFLNYRDKYSTNNEKTASTPLGTCIGKVEKDGIKYIHIGKGIIWINKNKN